MISLSLCRRHRPAHPGCELKWDAVGRNELALAAQQLSDADFNVRSIRYNVLDFRAESCPSQIKPDELHLAFDIGPLRSRNYSRFKRHTNASKPGLSRPMPSRSNTASSVATLTMTLTTDVAVLITRHVRRESTYIVWGGILAFEPPGDRMPLRNVLVKIAVDEEGAEDLQDHARHYEALAERGLYVGYYGIFMDSIGSTALVVEDLGDASPRSGSP